MAYVTRRPSATNDLLGTVATSALSILALLVMTRWLAMSLGPEEFGAVATGRRLALFCAPLLTFSVGLSLTRTLAASRLETSKLYELLGAAMGFVILVSFPVLAITILAQDALATLLFSSSRYADTVVASVTYLTMATTYGVWVGYLRGIGAIRASNLWALFGAWAQVAIAWSSQDAMAFLSQSSLLAVPILLATLYILSSHRKSLRPSVLAHSVKILLQFGWLRAPSTMFLDSVALTVQIWIAHVGGMAATAPFALAYMVMRVADGIINPISLTLLSRTQAVAAQLSSPLWHGRLIAGLEALTDVPVFLVSQLTVWLPVYVDFWVGPQYLLGVHLTQLLVVGLIPYVWALFSRGILDALDSYPWASYYLGISIVITSMMTAIMTFIFPITLTIALASTLLFALFGGLLWRHLHTRFSAHRMGERLASLSLSNIPMALLSWVIFWLTQSLPLWQRLTVATATILGLGAIYLYWALPRRTTWITCMRSYLNDRRIT